MFSYYRLKQFILALGDLFLIFISTLIATFFRFGRIWRKVFVYYSGASFITVIIYLVSFYIFDLYSLEKNKGSKFGEMGIRSFVSVFLAGIPISVLFYYLPMWRYGRGILFFQIVLLWAFVFLWRRLFNFMLILPPEKKNKAVIIGAGETGHFFYEWMKNADLPYQVIGFVDDDPGKANTCIDDVTVLGTTDQLLAIGKQKKLNIAIIAIVHGLTPKLIQNVLRVKIKGWYIKDVIDDYEKYTGRVPVKFIQDEWLLFAEGFFLLRTTVMQRIKRLIDLLCASLLIIISFPFCLITALAIKIDSEGPVIYHQVRVGRDGKKFNLLKFRSMRKDAEKSGVVWAQKNDPRVTRVGTVIRLLRIDEIPQMINIIHGDMSLIGPRPERPEFITRLEKQIPYYFIRHTVRPGITGWAQIKYPYGSSVQDALDKLEYDLYYIKNMSPLLDTQIFLKTIGVMFLGQGAR